MTPQALLVFTPFLALLYLVFALIQALRGKRQGTFAVILAFVAAAAAMVAYVMLGDTLVRTRLENLMLLNALIAFVGSLLILLIERRNQKRDPNRSYGILGIGLSILLALGTYVTPLLANAVPTNAVSTAAFNRSGSDSTFQTVSALTPGAPLNSSGAAIDLGAVLTTQTGLSSADLSTQITNGTSIAQLVSAHNGDMQAVTTAVKSSLDGLIESGGRGSQLLTRLGSDTTTVADQIVQGQLPAQAQSRVVEMLLGTGAASQGGGFQPQGNATLQPLAQATESAPQPTEATASDADSVAAVLTAQTGLSADEITTQLSGGSTLAALVSAHNGDLQAVTAAIKTSLDGMIESGGRAAGMISRMGTDTTTVADQIVQGQLPGQAQQFVISFLLTGALPQYGGNGGNGGAGGSGAFPQANSTPNPPATGSENAAAPVDPPQEQATATLVPFTPPPTSEEQRPTRIVFPTSTPTLDTAEATDAATSESASQSSSSAGSNSANATCTLVTNYNLNLRDKPGKDGSIVLLSIPMGTVVTADARTADGWYSVSYDGHNGWVSGEYAGLSEACANLPVR